MFINRYVNPALKASLPPEIYQQHPHDFEAVKARASGASESS